MKKINFRSGISCLATVLLLGANISHSGVLGAIDPCTLVFDALNNHSTSFTSSTSTSNSSTDFNLSST